ncbi:MAG: hypothetical protein K2M56_05640 [Muribaculaceae bacterium]|nr:hypothetical protein [Muribaculaceae bacterium]
MILVKEDVVLAKNPGQVKTKLGTSNIYEIPNSEYECESDVNNFIGTTYWQGIPMANIQICPFTYENGNLYFTKDFSIEIELEEYNVDVPIFKDLNQLKEDITHLVNNPEDVSEIISQLPQPAAMATSQCDYLIVTSEMLAESFNSLVEWKRKKGVKTAIITLEEIRNNFEGADIQEKIKQCIYQYHLGGTQYVLLGGDDTIVPVRYCQISAYPRENKYIYPTDLYYASFGGNFQWNANGDQYFGTTYDGMTAISEVYLTRLPVRTPEHINNYLTKLIAYERGYNSSSWDLSILMAGNILYVDNSSDTSQIGRLKSDAEYHADMVYDQAIKPYWNGRRIKFFDTYTDFEGGADYAFHPDNLNEQLAKSPMFFSIFTHGNFECWGTEDGHYIDEEGNDQYVDEYLYDRNNAADLVANNYTLITTIACDTNMFDEEAAQVAPNPSDPCLSEVLIRGKNNGIIGYLGCSREGYTTTKLESWGESEAYEAIFYYNLLTSSSTNFGRIVSMSKNQRGCLSHKSTMYPMNPIGDAEMPIYTEIPQDFQDMCIYGGFQNLIIETGTEDANIVVSDNKTGKISVIAKGEIVTFPPYDATICITKQNYKPVVYHVLTNDKVMDFYQEIPLKEGFKEVHVGQIYNDMYMPLDMAENANAIVISKAVCNNGNLHIEFEGTLLEEANYTLTVRNIMGVDSYTCPINALTQDIPVNLLNKGMYVLVLSANGIEIDSQKICIK